MEKSWHIQNKPASELTCVAMTASAIKIIGDQDLIPFAISRWQERRPSEQDVKAAGEVAAVRSKEFAELPIRNVGVHVARIEVIGKIEAQH